mmetsp:Transcript_4839/g.6532  ORF Transcript_4839/g.6532 Transcript_4839/m.6532 type:complete len:82 (-) Transcript_4839:118-363(-)
MPNAVRELHRNYNFIFQMLDYSSIGQDNVVFEEHEDDVDMQLDYVCSTFEEIDNLVPNLGNDDESRVRVVHRIPFECFAQI